MPQIEICTGDANPIGSHAKCAVFHVPAAGTLKRGKETFLAKGSAGVTETGRPSFRQALHGVSETIGGRIVTSAFTVREGEILKAWVTRRPVSTGESFTASIYLRVRANAAVREVQMKLLPNLRNAAVGYGYVRGSFDILTQEQLDLFRIQIPAPLRRFANDGPARRRCFEFLELQPERSALSVARSPRQASPEAAPAPVVTRRRRDVAAASPVDAEPVRQEDEDTSTPPVRRRNRNQAAGSAVINPARTLIALRVAEEPGPGDTVRGVLVWRYADGSEVEAVEWMTRTEWQGYRSQLPPIRTETGRIQGAPRRSLTGALDRATEAVRVMGISEADLRTFQNLYGDPERNNTPTFIEDAPAAEEEPPAPVVTEIVPPKRRRVQF